MVNNLKLLGYRIDRKIYYSVENKTIFSLDGSKKITLLRKTKARLLEYLLIESGGEVITDKELLANVWDKHGLSSSNQRLWLVIRELKIILRRFKVSDDLFIRVEGTGYFVDTTLIKEVLEVEKKIRDSMYYTIKH